MTKLFKTFLLSLALLPLWASAQTISIQVVETDPRAGTALSSGEPVYVRLQYQSDKPLRFQVKGFLDGSEAKKLTALNPAPLYPAGNGEAIAWVSYDKFGISELQIIAMDENWQTLHTVSHPIEMSWSGRPSRNWRQPAEWVQTLNAQLQTMAGSSTEQRPAPEVKEPGTPYSLLIWVLPLLGLAVIGALIVWSTKRNSK